MLVAVASIGFDLSLLELLLPLTVGARLVVADDETVRDGEALTALLRASDATYLHATPTTWRMLIAAGWDRLRTAVSGGEALDGALAEQLLHRADRLWNSYGPTETTIGSTLRRVERADQNRDRPRDRGHARLRRGPLRRTDADRSAG